jgi:hypothetical protein
VDPKLLKRAAKVTEKLGTSLPEALTNRAARDRVMRSLDDTETW